MTTSVPMQRDKLGLLLFGGGLLVYLYTRFYQIEQFPIYFFCDEAVHAVRFDQMAANHWHSVDQPKEILPGYFSNGGMYNLSLSVWVQGLASRISGKTVAGVRAVSALASLGGAIALVLLLRQVFRARESWFVVAVLAVTPCWFLHSRTGFETVLMVSAYAWFIYFYSLYRERSPRWIFAAVIAGAATFYAYAPGQGVIAITGFCLLCVDGKYHWTQRRWLLPAAGVGVVLFIPYVRFRIQHPDMLKGHLQTLGSYWVTSIPLTEKLGLFLKNYAHGVSPAYWFLPGSDQAVRHVVPYLPHLPTLLAPFAAAGFIRCLANWRFAPHRLILIALVATPFSSALVATMVTRMLGFVVPFALCTALGFDWAMSFVRSSRLPAAVRVAAFSLLAVTGVGLVKGAIAEAPLFSRDYGLYGVQWGSTALFRDILPRYFRSHPEANLVITHVAFNETEIFPEFFGWSKDHRVYFASLEDIAHGTALPEEKDLVLLKDEEFATLKSLPMVEKFEVLETLSLPDGRKGFFLGHMRLKPAFIEESRAHESGPIRPSFDRINQNGIFFSVRAGGMASGRPGALFSSSASDGLISTVGGAINLEIKFDDPIAISAVRVRADSNHKPKIAVWSFLDGVTQTTHVTFGNQASVEAGMANARIDSIRIELASTVDDAGRLLHIEVVPASAR